MTAKKVVKRKSNKNILDIDKRLSQIEFILGYTSDGNRNGNGIITIMEEMQEKSKKNGESLDGIVKTIDNLETQIAKLSENMIQLQYDIKTIDTKIIVYENTLKEQAIKINENTKKVESAITGHKLEKFMNMTIKIAGFLGAVGAIIGIIVFIHNALNK